MNFEDTNESTNVLKKLSSTFFSDLLSEKWQERKNALEKLLQLLIDNPKLDFHVNYNELITSLKKILFNKINYATQKCIFKILDKDSNINVSTVAAKCITHFAKNLQKHFSVYSRDIISIIFEKFKEKKPLLRDALVDCVDAVYATTSLDYLLDAIITASNKSNPNIKIQLNYFLYRVSKKLKTDEVSKKNLKELIPIVIKHANESDPGVREAACCALGGIMKFFGQNAALILFSSFANDKLKMAKVEEFYNKAIEEAKLELVEENVKDETASSIKNNFQLEQCTNEIIEKEIDIWELTDPVDILSKIPTNFKEDLFSKKWLVRKTALETLYQILTQNIRLLPTLNYSELVAELSKILNNDTNINVAAFAAKCITQIAKGLRKDFYNYSHVVLPVIFFKFKDKKTILKDALVECSDAVFFSTNLEAIVENVLEAGQKLYIDIKIQLDLFLYRVFIKLNANEISKKSLKEIIVMLTKHACDSDSNVRDASYSALGAIMKCVGQKCAISLYGDLAFDKTKLAKINQYYDQALADSGLLNKHSTLDVLNENFEENKLNAKILPSVKKNVTKLLEENKSNKIEKNQNLTKEKKKIISQRNDQINDKIIKPNKKVSSLVAKTEPKNKTQSAIVNKKNIILKTPLKLTALENKKFYSNNAKSDYNINEENKNNLNYNLMQPKFKSQYDFFKPIQKKIFNTGQKSRIPRLSLYQLSTDTK